MVKTEWIPPGGQKVEATGPLNTGDRQRDGVGVGAIPPNKETFLILSEERAKETF